MIVRRISRVACSVVPIAGLGVSLDAAAASATTPARRHHSVDAKKKKAKPTVKLGTTSKGKVLVAADGRSLYAFMPDGTDPTASHCTGGCTSIWLPLTAKKAVAGKGLDKAKIAVNATGQVSYGGHLLFEYSGDMKPGDTNGQNVANLWNLVMADGTVVA